MAKEYVSIHNNQAQHSTSKVQVARIQSKWFKVGGMGVNDTDRTIWRRAMDALLIVKYSQKATANKQTNNLLLRRRRASGTGKVLVELNYTLSGDSLIRKYSIYI